MTITTFNGLALCIEIINAINFKEINLAMLLAIKYEAVTTKYKEIRLQYNRISI